MSNEVEEPEEGSRPQAADPFGLARAFQPLADYYRSTMAEALRPLTEAVMSTSGIGEAIGKQLAEAAGVNAMLRETFAPLHEHFREYWAGVFDGLGSLKEWIYPPNLHDATPSVAEFEQLLLEEGIPLMWVPGPKVVRALLDAPDAVERRRIIGRRWKGIVNDCEAVIEDVDHPDLQESRSFAFDCVAALRDGHNNAAQALAANLLDSLMRANFDEAARVKFTSNRKKRAKFDLDDYQLRAALTFAPVWFAHAEYRQENGDPIPRVFGRHPSVHGVSRTQYSRINAVYGLMLVTSVLKFIDIDLER
ncbi:hypothetical protein JHN55_25210 [Streptomyces sp. MBT56]|uniref:hypothetical protein n=1 Tax=unclassified Streptomyces TaxID=2593676 RepID=UPI00190DBA4C|nr:MULTISPECIES: hypothetical protein [unclassified Streptomyces]MBK3559764.1 hypothetical protein [Streptomyces sp. MBT56]MBK3601294.1 hypothetical protein [Streptomyces sp. MBT54]MBK3615259.1 hypothetical protein [Streptomyces sp. MBT98]